MLHGMLYPVHQLVWNDHTDDANHLNFHAGYKPVASTEIGSDIHVVNLRTGALLPDDEPARPSSSISLLVHRLGYDCCFPAADSSASTSGEFSLNQLFPDYFGSKIRSMSLTSLHQGTTIEKSFTIELKPMELYTFELQP